MAEKKEEPKAEKEGEAKPSSGLVKKIGVAVAVIVVPLILVAVVFVFVLEPRLNPKEGGKDAKTEMADDQAKKGAEEAMPMADAAAVDFDDESVNVAPETPGGKPALLTYKCAIVVSSEVLAEKLAEKTKKPFFSSILLRLHSNRTKTELNDPRVKESILRQAKEECNAMLKRLYPEDKEAKILDVYHVKYTIFEL